ncbi:MAG: hypothetical protein R3E67_08970 [Pseudomonadales bacterium]
MQASISGVVNCTPAATSGVWQYCVAQVTLGLNTLTWRFLVYTGSGRQIWIDDLRIGSGSLKTTAMMMTA